MIRAGIIVTGTEVLSGAVSDRNGPWLSQRLQELGLEVAEICIVGDRPGDVHAALAAMRAQSLQLIVTSGGLGPTADDLTVEAVAGHLGLRLQLDAALEARIERIVRPLAQRRGISAEAFAAGNRKQAMVPEGAIVLEPVGTAPGLVLAGQGDSENSLVVILPGPPRELQPMWQTATETAAPLLQLLASAGEYEIETLRMFGIPESELAQTLRDAENEGLELARLEITTCQHRGELEITTRVPVGARADYETLADFLAERHPHELFSRDGASIDEQVAQLLRGSDGDGQTLALCESCTGGLLAGRITDLPGSSDYLLGGFVTYADTAKSSEAHVPQALIEQHGAVSAEVAGAMAQGARVALGASVGVGVTGVAGPGGGSEEKPVGLVWFAVAGPGTQSLVRSVRLPGNRRDVRERAVTVAMHLLRRAMTAS
ncbi:MAG TPA: competence/damage-inducible protein A [Solirubrobacteraceae bacterium]